MKTEELKKQKSIDLEPFYEALEVTQNCLKKPWKYYWKW